MRCPHCGKLISDSPDGVAMHYKRAHPDKPQLHIVWLKKTDEENYTATICKEMREREAKRRAHRRGLRL